MSSGNAADYPLARTLPPSCIRDFASVALPWRPGLSEVGESVVNIEVEQGLLGSPLDNEGQNDVESCLTESV